MIERIQAREVPAIIGRQGHLIFGVTFVKRSTGEQRNMLCRQRVRKHLAGGDAAYSFNAKGLVPVFDVQRNGYRCIPLDGVQVLRVQGQTYVVDEKARSQS